MELSTSRPEEGAATRVKALPSGLTFYLAAIYVFGVAGVAFVVIANPWSATAENLLIWPTAFLAVAAIAGEVKPIALVSGGSEPRTLSTSAPFVLALLVVAGVGIAVLVQAVASVADDLIRKREFKKSLFNTTQYALSLISAGAVYSALTGTPFFSVTGALETRDIGALLIAGVVMIGVNWVLVAGVVALSIAQPLIVVLREDVRDFIVILVVLLCVGGIAAVVAGDGVAALVLLAAPVVAAHLFAAAAARHAYEATHDMLTGLGNRGQAHAAIRRVLEVAAQAHSVGPGLIILNIDHFKDFNDTLGHPVGDRILQEVALRLKSATPQGASVHRLGGDEFAVVIDGGVGISQQTARDLLAALEMPVWIDGLELLVRVSAGVAIAPRHGLDAATLMKNCDIALHHAKVERDRITTYSAQYDVNTVDRLQLLADLHSALDSNQLSVVYQPQVTLGCRRTVAVEALVRWDHPVRGAVRPDQFIQLAENSGLIFPLTMFVFDTALAQLAQWRQAGHDLRMSVNLSARHLSDLTLPDRIAAVARRHAVPFSAIVLEVTETAVLSDPARADSVIRALRGLGIAVAIDDYGTGNASLGYLRRLHIDELKIDRSFVGNMGIDANDLIIVKSTIALALALGVRVVAEGIEDEATAVMLRDMGDIVGQGYHLGRPAPPDQIEAALVAERSVRDAGQRGSR